MPADRRETPPCRACTASTYKQLLFWPFFKQTLLETRPETAAFYPTSSGSAAHADACQIILFDDRDSTVQNARIAYLRRFALRRMPLAFTPGKRFSKMKRTFSSAPRKAKRFRKWQGTTRLPLLITAQTESICRIDAITTNDTDEYLKTTSSRPDQVPQPVTTKSTARLH